MKYGFGTGRRGPIAFALSAAGALLLGSACGGAAPGTRDASEVQSDAMSKSFAGKNRCDAKRHPRPFIIEWDATDTSSFEAHAKDDVIFVRYEGCELEVLDGCRNGSVRGQLGSYRNVEWTSGSVEVLEIQNEGELYAKLPLGANTLGGRVQGGEKFRMEYFVAGTRNATRDKIYRGDLDAAGSACKGATHFVYAYNLGAFALGAGVSSSAEAGGTLWGAGVGGSSKSSQRAEKTGGLLASCRAESARETETCKTPIRLALREIEEGSNPDQAAALAPETPTAANLAGQLKAETDKEKKAAEHLDAARLKMNAKDGKGCLADLDVHDKLDPRPMGMSTNAKSGMSMMRAQCLMVAGQCDAGKTLYRRSLEANASGGVMSGPEMRDKQVDSVASMFCQGANMSARDRIQKAMMELNLGAYQAKKDVPFCLAQVKTLRDLIPSVKPKDEDDSMILNAPATATNAGVACVAKAGDCAAAWKLFLELDDAKTKETLFKNASESERERMHNYTESQKKATPEVRATVQRSMFEAFAPKCKQAK